MLNNLKIGTKMMVLSGIVILLMLIILLWSVVGLSTTSENGLEVSGGNKLRAGLMELEIKHLKWAHKVRDFLDDPSITELKVKLDHKTCALGKWYYGDGRQQAEAMLPEIRSDLQALEEPHRLLHASGRAILSLYSPFSPINAEARAVFINETVPNLQKVGATLNRIIEVSNVNIMTDQELISAAESTRTGISLVGAIALIVGIIMSVFVTRSLTAPMRKVGSMIEELEYGHLDTRLQMKRKDEIGQMAATMDRFADSLQNEIVASLQKLASGDLTFDIKPRDNRDLVRGSLQKLGIDLNNLLGQIQTASDQIASGSIQVSDSAQSLSQGATESAASLEEIGSTMNVISSQTNQSADNAGQANDLAGNAARAAATGSQRMSEMIGAMGEINDAGQNIGKIIKVIDEIAFQTNLLALNAAVEAARAGQHGKGFAVVAEEVRNLAARSAKAASETAELIEGSVEKATNGTQIAERTSESLGEIVSAINKVDDLLGEIAAASKEQASGVEQVNVGLQQIDQVIQQSTASAEESAATSEDLSKQAGQLKNQLTHFTLKGNPSNRTNFVQQTPVALPASTINTGWGTVSPPESGNRKLTIHWDDRLATGFPIVDQQHQQLISLVNQLVHCMTDGDDRMLLGRVIDELVDYTVYHFRTEEDLMKSNNYPGFENHKQAHDKFTCKVGDYVGKLKNGEKLPPEDIYKFLKNWLTKHIEKEDQESFAPYSKART